MGASDWLNGRVDILEGRSHVTGEAHEKEPENG